jgi:hypothetical protein
MREESSANPVNRAVTATWVSAVLLTVAALLGAVSHGGATWEPLVMDLCAAVAWINVLVLRRRLSGPPAAS